MRHYDLSPLYRSTVGFDRLFSLIDSLGEPDAATPAYPPYNIERTGENAYRISMAVAGFAQNDLDIEVKENGLVIRGRKGDDNTGQQGEFLHRGIATRAFERRFQLADHVEVTGASLENGLLHVELKREIPETMKPRSIAIRGGQTQKAIEQKTASAGCCS